MWPIQATRLLHTFLASSLKLSKPHLLHLGDLYDLMNDTWWVLNKQCAPLQPPYMCKNPGDQSHVGFFERVTQLTKVNRNWDFMHSCGIHLPRTVLNVTSWYEDKALFTPTRELEHMLEIYALRRKLRLCDLPSITAGPKALASENTCPIVSQATWNLHGRAPWLLTAVQKVYLPTAFHLPRSRGPSECPPSPDTPICPSVSMKFPSTGPNKPYCSC